jgi:hypothetical protein
MYSENIIILLLYYRISKTSDNVSHPKWGNRTTQAGPTRHLRGGSCDAGHDNTQPHPSACMQM